MFEKELHDAGVQIIAAIPAVVIGILVALGGVIVAMLHSITKKLERAATSRASILVGQEEIREIVKNGPANKVARRVLDAEDSYAAIKLNDIVGKAISNLGTKDNDSVQHSASLFDDEG